ncbi:MAG: HPr family phosphocarrier protein [Myxococcales bacterium]|nr:HPr family phosphocarrier protein [Myxococcales bacterium]
MSRPLPHIHRVDPRLVHATLLEAWVPYLAARHLVVADEEVATNLRGRTIFEMSARDVANTYFVAETLVPAVLSKIPPNEGVIVVYGGLQSFTRALSIGLQCQQMILGHLPSGDNRWRVHPSVYLGQDDYQWVDRIREAGVEVVVRPLPSDQPMGLRQDPDGRPVLVEMPPTIKDTRSALQSQADGQADDAHVSNVLVGQMVVVNERGLHLRAAHLLAQCAGRFVSSVNVISDGRTVNAKSLLGLTTLGAALGTKLELRVEGSDAEVAYTSVKMLFESGFDEGRA